MSPSAGWSVFQSVRSWYFLFFEPFSSASCISSECQLSGDMYDISVDTKRTNIKKKKKTQAKSNIKMSFNQSMMDDSIRKFSLLNFSGPNLSYLKRFWVLDNFCSSTPTDGTHRSYEKPKTLALSLVRLVCSVLVASNTLASPTMGCGANLGQFL